MSTCLATIKLCKFKAAFWITSPNNIFIGNSVVGGSNYGFWFRMSDSNGISYTFFNNTVHSCGTYGLWINPGYNPWNWWNPTVAVIKFENFICYSCQKGAQWDNSNYIQFRNMVMYDHAVTAIETNMIAYNQYPNSIAQYTFYNDSLGPLIANSIIIGNSDSSSNYSISESGIVVAWDRGLLLESVYFYNFPSEGSKAIRSTNTVLYCRLLFFIF